MPFQSVPQCAEAVITGTIGSQTVVNVLNFSFGASYSGSDIANLAIDVDGEVNAAYPGLINGNVIYQYTKARGLANVNDFEFVQGSGPTPGSVGALPLPANVSMAITLRTALTGRSARGRFYAWPTGSNNLDSSPNLFKSTYAAGLVTMLENIQVAAAVHGWALGIVSRFTLGTTRPTGVFFPVTSIEARNLVADSQRGRLPKGH